MHFIYEILKGGPRINKIIDLHLRYSKGMQAPNDNFWYTLKFAIHESNLCKNYKWRLASFRITFQLFLQGVLIVNTPYSVAKFKPV